MKKRSIIGLSIVLCLIVLIGVLFGAVFCLRNQKVVAVGETALNHTANEILKAGDLSYGQPIFMINKEKAIKKIESTYADVKVVQIKTTSLFDIEIIVRTRVAMAYAEFNEKYYLLDEELKVMEILEKAETSEPTHLTNIKSELLKIDAKTAVCDFVGNAFQTNAFYNTYNAMINTFQKDGAEGKEYFDREDVQEMIRNIEFEQHKTFNKVIITTKYGVKLDIENPNQNLTNKMNVCYATIEDFIAKSNNKEKSGTIKIYYDLDNELKCIYVPQV